MLKEGAVRKELEVLDDQEHALLAAARASEGDPAGYREAVEGILLPHQLDELRQLIGRYHCLASGVMRQFDTGDAFAVDPPTPGEVQRVRASLVEVAKTYYAANARELHALDSEVRKTLTRRQLQAVNAMIGDRKILDAPFLDFAILRLETIADRRPDRLNLDLNESAAVLGRSTQFQLAVTGQLQPSKNETPMHFFAAFRNGITRAGLRLDADQRELLADFEKNLISEVAGKSMRVYRLLTEQKLTLDEAKDILTSVATREINMTVSVFDTLLSHEQQDQLDEYVLRRDLAQRGMLPILIEGQRIVISDDQKKTLLDIVERKLAHFRELSRDTETEIWHAVEFGLAPAHRKLWMEAYGDGTLKALPTSPVLLLFRPRAID